MEGSQFFEHRTRLHVRRVTLHPPSARLSGVSVSQHDCQASRYEVIRQDYARNLQQYGPDVATSSTPRGRWMELTFIKLRASSRRRGDVAVASTARYLQIGARWHSCSTQKRLYVFAGHLRIVGDNAPAARYRPALRELVAAVPLLTHRLTMTNLYRILFRSYR